MLKQSHIHQISEQNGGLRLPSADAFGIFASGLCLVHCLVFPLLVLALPALGSRFVHDDRTHFFLAFFVTAFCLSDLVPGYLRHSNKRVLMTMLFGLGLVLFATFASALTLGEVWEIPLITVGNLLVVASHLSNRRLLACCESH